jgi:glycolate oxidase FAD binding subunit
MAGSLGTLGVLLEVSLKALPLPAANATIRREHPAAHAVELMNQWAAKPLPITATCYTDGALYIRLSGAESAVRAARERLGGEEVPAGEFFWQQVRDHAHEFFQGASALWRMSVKPTSAPLAVEGPQLIEWNGALRWIAADLEPAAAREAASQAGGHATLFRGGDKRSGVFHPLTAPIAALHRRIKSAFDPCGILGRGRLYPDL